MLLDLLLDILIGDLGDLCFVDLLGSHWFDFFGLYSDLLYWFCDGCFYGSWDLLRFCWFGDWSDIWNWLVSTII